MNFQQQIDNYKKIREIFVYGYMSSNDYESLVFGGNDKNIIEKQSCKIHFINISNKKDSKIIESDSHEFFGVLTYLYLSSLSEEKQNVKFYLNNMEIDTNNPLELYKLGLKDGSKIMVESD